jgi:ABC-2 type transport system ATP-binding protein
MGMRQRLGLAACLLGDPELLILDEPMNGLDPAGMVELREFIRELVDEGRTVMLCSHLLDEVERTCDAAAIVDHGRVIRQGMIADLVRGATGDTVQIGCSDAERAATLLRQAAIADAVEISATGLTVTFAQGATTQLVAELNRRLVDAGIGVHRLEQTHATLADWFLSVTSRLGEPS